jgi:hypothetical protein
VVEEYPAAARWSFNGEAVSGGEEMGRRNGESGERNSGTDSFCRGRGGFIVAAAPCRASGGRRRPGSLTGWAHVSVRGGDGPTRPERDGVGGPRLGWKRRDEAGPNPLLGLKSKRVKENQF